jgi:hypothetical protein
MSIAALKAARPLLRDWRAVLVDSNQDVTTKKLNPAEAHELARFDRALALIDRALERHKRIKKRKVNL